MGNDEDVAVGLVFFGFADDGLVEFLADVGYESVQTGCDLVGRPVSC